MFFPLRTKNPPERIAYCTFALILLNVLVFAFTNDGYVWASPLILRDWALSGGHLDPLHILTSMFLHGGIVHLLGNMWFLFVFGQGVEGRLGSWKYVFLYLLAGVAGGLMDYFVVGQFIPHYHEFGASAAIMGVVGAAIYLFPFAPVTVFSFWGVWFRIRERPMWYVGLITLGFEVILACLGPDGVAHFAHLGGAAAGALLAILMRAKRDNALTTDAKVRIASLGDLRMMTVSQLSAYAAADPENTRVVLDWMFKSATSSYDPSTRCVEHFMRLLPRIIQHEPPQQIGHVLEVLSATGTKIPGHYFVSLASRLETAGDHAAAYRLYDRALTSDDLSGDDREAATFRSAHLAETTMRDRSSAVLRYRELVDRYPFGPFAGQAEARLRVLVV